MQGEEKTGSLEADVWLTLPLVLGLKDELEALTAPKSVLTYAGVLWYHTVMDGYHS